jgi:hypothetical protein
MFAGEIGTLIGRALTDITRTIDASQEVCASETRQG